jgi:hypothetical protein
VAVKGDSLPGPAILVGSETFLSERESQMRKCFVLASVIASLLLTQPAFATIVVGPWTFADDAFADDATQIAPGKLDFYGTASNIDEALTGYSPTTMVVNLGNPSFSTANLIQLDFTDLAIQNGPGDDFVFFQAGFFGLIYDFEFAGRALGETSFGPFVATPKEDFVNTGVVGPLGQSTLYGAGVDLSDLGFAEGAIVTSIQFRAVRLSGDSALDADVVMAGVLNGVPLPEPAPLALLGLGSATVLVRRRR